MQLSGKRLHRDFASGQKVTPPPPPPPYHVDIFRALQNKLWKIETCSILFILCFKYTLPGIRATARMDTIQKDTIPNGYNPEWTQSRMDTIPNGHHPEWAPS